MLQRIENASTKLRKCLSRLHYHSRRRVNYHEHGGISTVAVTTTFCANVPCATQLTKSEAAEYVPSSPANPIFEFYSRFLHLVRSDPSSIVNLQDYFDTTINSKSAGQVAEDAMFNYAYSTVFTHGDYVTFNKRKVIKTGIFGNGVFISRNGGDSRYMITTSHTTAWQVDKDMNEITNSKKQRIYGQLKKLTVTLDDGSRIFLSDVQLPAAIVYRNQELDFVILKLPNYVHKYSMKVSQNPIKDVANAPHLVTVAVNPNFTVCLHERTWQLLEICGNFKLFVDGFVVFCIRF